MSTVESNNEPKQTKPKGKKSKTTKSDDQVQLEQQSQQLIEEEQINLNDNALNDNALNDNELNEDDNETHEESSDELNNPDIIIENMNIVENALKILSEVNLKNYYINKNFFGTFTESNKRINKLYSNFNQATMNYLVKAQSIVIKKESKSTKKLNKNTDKSKCAIHIPRDTYPEVLQYMKREPGTQVSQGNIMQEINAYVKTQKTKKNPDIFVEGDNRSFKIIGELVPLFDFIKSVMIERGDLSEGDDFPTQVSYTGLMKYFKYCFLKSEKK